MSFIDSVETLTPGMGRPGVRFREGPGWELEGRTKKETRRTEGERIEVCVGMQSKQFNGVRV